MHLELKWYTLLSTNESLATDFEGFISSTYSHPLLFTHIVSTEKMCKEGEIVKIWEVLSIFIIIAVF